MKGTKLGVIIAGSFLGGIVVSAVAVLVTLIVYVGKFDEDLTRGEQYDHR